MPGPETERQLSSTVMLPNGEIVSAPDYQIVTVEERLDAMAKVLGTKLLPSDRRSFEFARRSLDGIITDPRDWRFTPDITIPGPTPRSYYDD